MDVALHSDHGAPAVKKKKEKKVNILVFYIILEWLT